MNDIEKLNSVKFNIRKALESQGSDITVDTPFEEYPKYVMELSGGEGTSKVTLIEEQSFTGLKPSDKTPFYVARLEGEPFLDSEVDITFDAVLYSVSGSDGVYGDMDSETMIPNFTEYPFVIAVNDDEVMIVVADEAQHTIKVEVEREPVFPKGSIEIVQNGKYNVTNYESAIVDVPASAVVSGTKNISSNGEHNVTEYQIAKVNVPSFQYGELTITNNLGINVVVSNLDTNGAYGTAEGQVVSIPDGKTKTVRMTVGKTSPTATKYTLVGPVTIYSSRGIPDFVVNQSSAFPKAYSGSGVLKDGKTTSTTALINITNAIDSQGRDTTSGGIVLALANQQ